MLAKFTKYIGEISQDLLDQDLVGFCKGKKALIVDDSSVGLTAARSHQQKQSGKQWLELHVDRLCMHRVSTLHALFVCNVCMMCMSRVTATKATTAMVKAMGWRWRWILHAHSMHTMRA